jgi:hypothetical protein
MTDQMPTRHQNFLSIMDKLATLPRNVDHNGKSEDEKTREAAGIAAYMDAGSYAHLEEPPAPQVGMKPNRAQGHGGSPVPTQHQGSPLERIRATLADRRDSVFDGGGAA